MKHLLLRIYFLLGLLCLFSCQEDTISPDVFGSINGEVVLAEDETMAIGDARITTSPVTTTVYTDDLGRFNLENVKAGTYSVRIEKEGYAIETESIAVNENEITDLLVKLQVDTSTNNVPTEPGIIMPANASTNQALDLRLSWTASDVDPEDVLRFDVQLFTAGQQDIVQVLSSSLDTFVDLSDLRYGTTYFWQVTVDDGQNIINGPVWSFETLPFPDFRFHFARAENGIYDIYAGDETGQVVRLTQNGASNWRPRMSPLRDKIAFISNAGIEAQLYCMNRDGSDIRPITTIPIAGFKQLDLDFCWSPDGSRLLYMNNNRLYTVRLDGTDLQLLAEAPAGTTFSECDWTGQGNTIIARTTGADVYESYIFTLDAQGNFLLQVFNDVPGATGGPAYSIDGSTMLYTQDVSGFEANDGRQLDAHIFTRDLISQQFFDLSFDKVDGTNDLDARYSPNGAQVIFVNTNNDGISVKNIWTMDLDGENRELLFENAEMPDWQ